MTLTPRAALVSIVAIVAVTLVVAFVVSSGDDDPPPAVEPADDDGTPPAEEEPRGDESAPAENSLLLVPLVPCEPLLTSEEVAEALGGDTFEFARGETCVERLADDDNVAVEIGPGNPADFLPGFRVIGVAGEQVDGLGDGAVWFAGPESELGTDGGLLAVRAGTPRGVLHLRLLISRPGTELATQREIAGGLAAKALPRFPGVDGAVPGVEIAEPEPEEIPLVTSDREPADRSRLGYVDNILTRADEGEWTIGEGLVATLQLLTGEADEADVLRSTDLGDRNGTAVVARARAHLEENPDDPAAAELDRLLDVLLVTPDELERWIAEGDPVELPSLGITPAAEGEVAVGIGGPIGLASVTRSALALSPAQEERSDPDCPLVWYGRACLATGVVPGLEQYGAKYRYVAPLPPTGDDYGWNTEDLTWVFSALVDTVTTYEAITVPYKGMPSIEFVLTPHEGFISNYNAATPTSSEPVCHVHIGYDTTDPQRVAGATADCLIDHNFGESETWWRRGLAVYLSGVVYPTGNSEHVTLPSILAGIELDESLMEWGSPTWSLWEYMHSQSGVNGVLRLIDRLGSLGTQPGIDTTWQDFAMTLTDVRLDDIGPGIVPYNPQSLATTVDGPVTIGDSLAGQFAINRIHTTVPGGKKACVSYDQQSVRVTWRDGWPASGSAGDWRSNLPDELTGQMTFVASTTRRGSNFAIEVKKVVDEDDECEEEPDGAGGGDDGSRCELEIGCDESGYYFYVPGVGRHDILPEFMNTPG